MTADNKKVECPHCGYKMPIIINTGAKCEGLTVKCKARHCKKVFEIIVK